MDINLLRSLVTVASLAAFLGIVWWAYGPARKERFERDALLPFRDDEDNLRPPHSFPLSRAERGNVQREMAPRPFPERENGKRS
jgi:cytochrome c oxidase cbb3-type subunit 4